MSGKTTLFYLGFIALIITISLVLMIVCAPIEKESSKYRSAPQKNVLIYVDPETGVNYLIYEGNITVRYNEDGSIMVSEKENGYENKSDIDG